MMANRIVALLSDFGYCSGYAAQMKAVILKDAERDVQFVDISHSLKSFQIDQAAFILKLNYGWFPKNTIFIAIVDPGVGTERAVIAVESCDMIFIAPDNGILSAILKDAKRIVLLKGESATFAGRDICARAASQIINGKRLEEIGQKYKQMPKIIELEPTLTDSSISGKIFHIDDFGNIISNINSDYVKPGCMVKWGDIDVSRWAKNYSQAEIGKLVNIINSSGYLELAAFKNSAEALAGLKIGDAVKIAKPNNK